MKRLIYLVFALLVCNAAAQDYVAMPADSTDVEVEDTSLPIPLKPLTLRGASTNVNVKDKLDDNAGISSDTVAYENTKEEKTIHEDLEDINSQMSNFFGRIKKTDFTDWIRECVFPHKSAGFPQDGIPQPNKYSNYYVKDMPSGLCPFNLYLSFKGGMWNDEIQAVLNKTDLQTAYFDDIKDKLPPMSLPAYMSFPRTAKDVAQIVKFANRREKKVSIKNSGHSYTQGSYSANSININLREFPKYSFREVYECSDETVMEPLSGPPCKLALARGKTAVARIGGGQGNDDIYRSVIDYNYKQPRDKRYFALGGAEGMIGGGGGFFQGGGLGIGEERLYGNAADQVLEIEMILPDGKHVKFGPTEWEHKEGYIYPQTIKVEGKCNNNVKHDESKWEWVECPDSKPFPDVTFEDLWFAVRGGGGGVWGVVLSTYQQLHDLIPQFYLKRDQSSLEAIESKFCTPPDFTTESCKDYTSKFKPMVHSMYLDFLIDLLWNVDDNEIGIDEYLSVRCGCTWQNPFLNPMDDSMPYTRINCHGHGIQEKFQEAWKTSIAKSNRWLEEYRYEEMECLLGSLIYLEGGFYDKWRREFIQIPIMYDQVFYSPTGRLIDNDGVERSYVLPTLNGIIVPPEFFRTKSNAAHELLIAVTGGHTLPHRFASDGMEPTSAFYRSGGIQTVFPDMESSIEMYESYYPELLSAYGYNSTSDDFPGVFEYNHIYASNPGLLKSDPTKVCPPSFSNEEKKVHCMSMQEGVFGTNTFNRLTTIKSGIDPKNLFDVHFGIGNNERSNAMKDYQVTEHVPQGPAVNFTDESAAKITNSSVCASELNDASNPFEDKNMFNEETH